MRRASFGAALSYYGAALWPIIPGAKNFFGPDASVLAAVALWVFASAALASVWPIVWSVDLRQAIWRSPLGLVLSVVPPLGIIGLASPLTAAGFLFPRTSWCGLLAGAVLSGALAAWPRRAAIAIAFLAVTTNALHFTDPEPLPGWQGVNTNFGAIAHARVNPITGYQAAQWIQQFSLSADARVMVFPETVVSAWTAATEAFWQQTLARLRASGKTILIGARLPTGDQPLPHRRYDFSADLVALRGGRPTPFRSAARIGTASDHFRYDNAVVIRGADTAEFVQRIPVPIGMWNPFRSQGARMNSFGSTLIPIAGERAAILVCYEQLLTWPILTSVFNQPTVLVAVANDYWATETPIPAVQYAVVRGWSRLLGIPVVTATNQ
jgi:hypothetical protein